MPTVVRVELGTCGSVAAFIEFALRKVVTRPGGKDVIKINYGLAC